MWTCSKCGEKIEEQFDSCWKCGTFRNDSSVETEAKAGGVPESKPPKPEWQLAYKYFRGTLATWDQLFSQAAEFATEVGPERVVNISHSADDDDGVVTVWYWTETAEVKPQNLPEN
jgi:hypothetical protein